MDQQKQNEIVWRYLRKEDKTFIWPIDTPELVKNLEKEKEIKSLTLDRLEYKEQEAEVIAEDEKTKKRELKQKFFWRIQSAS